VLLLALWQPPMAEAQPRWQDLWQTPDQQGAAALNAGDAATAAERFSDPAWQATAEFSAGNYAAAAKGFGKLGDADSWYNRGNALAMQGDYAAALEAFEKSLEMAPGEADAEANRDLMQQLLEQQQENQQQQDSEQDSESAEQSQQGQSEGDDASQQESEGQGETQDAQNPSSQGQQGDPQRPEGDVANSPDSDDPAMQEAMEQRLEEQTAQQMRKFDQALEEQQKLEQWLRRVPDEPGGLLRNKFRYEAIQRLRNGEKPDDDVRW
jgi:Ca-activated chloride channel family protein